MRVTYRLRAVVLVGALALVSAVGFAVPAAASYDTTPSPTWDPDGPVHAIAVFGDRVYIGGNFTSMSNPATGETVARSSLAALDASTGELVRSWSADADGDVRALAMSADGTRVLAGGTFRQVDGTSRPRLAALSATDGSVLSPWKGRATGVVRDLLVVGYKVLVGGGFGSLNGNHQRGVGVLQVADGDLAGGFSASTDRIVYGLAMQGGSLVLAGKFEAVNGTPRAALAAVSPDSGALLPWSPRPLCDRCAKYWDVVTDDQRVYVAIGGPGGRVAAYSPATGQNLWVTRANGDAQALALADGVLYVGGHFNGDGALGGHFRTQLAAVNEATGAVAGFAPTMYRSYPGVWALTAASEALYVGGHFNGAGARQQSPFFARFGVS